MNTARVYNELAALSAEREELRAKLEVIDSQLEYTMKKKALAAGKK